MRPITQRKGQIDIPVVTFVILFIALLFLAPLMLKIIRTTVPAVASGFGNVTSGGNEASQAINYVFGVFISFWDTVIIFAFVFAVLLLFVSALFIDTNPFFIILYIVVLVLTVIFAPTVLEAVDRVYEMNAFAEEVTLLPMIDFLRLNFGLILMVIGILTMIIMYAKIRFFPSR